MPKVVPELLCTDITSTIKFYLDVLGFELLYERPEETFAYLSLNGADLMFEQFDGPGRRWITGDLQRPFGRGMNLQIETADVLAMHSRVQERAPGCIYLPLEKKSYMCRNEEVAVHQFIVQDPDGYLLRFSQ